MTCQVCGATDVRDVRETRTVVADDGTTLAFEDSFTRCAHCGAEYYTREQSLASSRAAATVMRTHEGLLAPNEIRALRDRLRLTQADLEHALGVGAKTVVRWEKGTVRQSRLADRFLRTLAVYPFLAQPVAGSTGEGLTAWSTFQIVPAVGDYLVYWQDPATAVSVAPSEISTELPSHRLPEVLLEAA